jgi:cytochrome c553
MIARLFRIFGFFVGTLGAAFAVKKVFRKVSRQLVAAFVSGWRGGDATPMDAKIIERRGIKKGVVVTLLGIAVVGGLAGALVFVSGIIPIKASSRHWPITQWILKTGMERSVATHGVGIEAPPLNDPDLILKGAGHYEIGCRPCHGSPGLPQPLIAHMMTPLPPYLPPRIGKWEPEELFYIVKHGVKFTGMPAWPSLQRDDEVWAMVAFLQKLPELDEAAYRGLAYGEPQPPAPMEALEGVEQIAPADLQTCARCHGFDGIGRGNGAFPNLAGQSAEYLQTALEAYARGDRHSGIMQPIAVGLTAASIRDLSRYYSKLPLSVPPIDDEAEKADIERGRTIAQHGIPEQRVPSCVDCHAPEATHRKPEYPILAGQPVDYLVLQLELFEQGHRGGSAYAHLMHAIVPRMTQEQMRDVALYLRSLQPPERTAESTPVSP